MKNIRSPITIILLCITLTGRGQFPDFIPVDTGAIYASTGHHVASGWFDIDNDNDNDMDVIITNSSGYNYTNHPNLLYKNELDGYFTRVTDTGYTIQNTNCWITWSVWRYR